MPQPPPDLSLDAPLEESGLLRPDRKLREGLVRLGLSTVGDAVFHFPRRHEDRTRFDVGYGLCLGHNERKAIAMANLDISVHRDAGRSPLEQSVLLTTDGLDASGFLEHLKLPHYVTFRSMTERKLAMRSERAVGARARRTGTAISEPDPAVTS